MRDRDRLEWPLIDALNAVLKPAGFRRMGLHWRKDAVDSILALWLDNILGINIFKVRFGAWVKALEQVDLKYVRPIPYRSHIYLELGDPCPPPLKLKLFRANHFDVDYFAVLLPAGDEIEPDWEDEAFQGVDMSEPLTDAYRVAVYREALERYALPVMNAMETEAGLRGLLENADLGKAADEKLFQYFGLPVPETGDLTLF